MQGGADFDLQGQLKLQEYKELAVQTPHLKQKIFFIEQKLNRVWNELLNVRSQAENSKREERKLLLNYEIMDQAFKKIFVKLSLSRVDVNEKDIA